ncbi:MAG: DUF1080 domain-containing protein [Planctomycetaceae bacterium]
MSRFDHDSGSRLSLRCAFAFFVVAFSGCGESPNETPSTPATPPATTTPDHEPTSKGDATGTESAVENIVTPYDSMIQAQSTGGEFVALDLQEFKGFPYDFGSVWSLADGVWKCTGTPKGYIVSGMVYENFTLRYECRFPPLKEGEDPATFKGNTGCLLYIDNKDKVWPVCLEVQGKYAETGTIKANGHKSLTVEVEDFPDVRGKSLKPIGEWNQLEIASENGALTVKLNGEIVCRSQPTILKMGRIGFQSENSEVEFRNVTILVP